MTPKSQPAAATAPPEAAALDRWMIWVDGVGGFLALPTSPWVVGGPAAELDGGICVQAALRRREAELTRSGRDYSLRRLVDSESDRSTAVGRGDHTQASTAGGCKPLRRDDAFRLGEGVHFGFACPHPLSTSARLTVERRFRFRPHVDAVLLLADTLVIGASNDCHIVSSEAEQAEVLFRREKDWFCKPLRAPVSEAVAVRPGCRMEVCGTSLTLEPA